jgi:hypothetical protein
MGWPSSRENNNNNNNNNNNQKVSRDKTTVFRVPGIGNERHAGTVNTSRQGIRFEGAIAEDCLCSPWKIGMGTVYGFCRLGKT